MANDSCMKRVLIIGCPGSGKSTFARELQAVTGLPLCHLDLLYWNADRTTVPKVVFLQRLKETLRQEHWIIDGNYSKTLELRLQHCDTVLFLDYPTEVCLSGIASRIGKSRPDMPWTEEKADLELLELVRCYPERERQAVLALLDRYAGEKNIITFRTREDTGNYLAGLRNAK